MDEYDIKRLALILAVQARIEGMKAENAQRVTQNHSMAYLEADFEHMAVELENLAYKPKELL
jgi:hypothetical protein